ncbi:geranylgeranyl reductase family protein [Saccharothrix algeriensis]|uniref:Menaquinone reductase n=1 Tax=Catellatospora bangladeshensis TaxID=310355 RepID=A0A8J3JI93_9ACTN|nr:FAD-dependent monooxygenase [Catellatospora bangladeshensis]GIF81128.1 menaquinone reductase [Catellatospora bangladeshensis]
MYDIAIVGAGPAGSAAALAAARLGARVLLLDRAAFPRDKACGDGIAPQALAVAARLGVTGLADGFAPVGSLALAGPGGAAVARELPEPAYVIPREVFDARLVDAAVAAGAELHRHTVRELVLRPDGVVLGDGLAARVVVGADGANSTVRRLLGVPRNPAGALAVAVRAYAPMPTGTGAPPDRTSTEAGAPPDRTSTVAEAHPLQASVSGTAHPAVGPGGDDGQRIVMAGGSSPAYAWSFPIGDGRRNVGYGELTATGQVSRARLLERMHELLGDTDPAALSQARAHHLPLSTRRPAPGHGRVLLAGDALSLINPFTGEGIFYALVSGELAGRAAVTPGGAAAGAAYSQALRRRLGRHLRHTAAVAWLTARPWLVDAGIRAAARDRRVFDGLVALGLGDGLLTPRLLGAVARAAAHRTR